MSLGSPLSPFPYPWSFITPEPIGGCLAYANADGNDDPDPNLQLDATAHGDPEPNDALHARANDNAYRHAQSHIGCDT